MAFKVGLGYRGSSNQPALSETLSHTKRNTSFPVGGTAWEGWGCGLVGGDVLLGAV